MYSAIDSAIGKEAAMSIDRIALAVLTAFILVALALPSLRRRATNSGIG